MSNVTNNMFVCFVCGGKWACLSEGLIDVCSEMEFPEL